MQERIAPCLETISLASIRESFTIMKKQPSILIAFKKKKKVNKQKKKKISPKYICSYCKQPRHCLKDCSKKGK